MYSTKSTYLRERHLCFSDILLFPMPYLTGKTVLLRYMYFRRALLVPCTEDKVLLAAWPAQNRRQNHELADPPSSERRRHGMSRYLHVPYLTVPQTVCTVTYLPYLGRYLTYLTFPDSYRGRPTLVTVFQHSIQAQWEYASTS